jgi:hypothetical protein
MTAATAASLGPDVEAVIDDLAAVALPGFDAVVHQLADLVRQVLAETDPVKRRQATADALLAFGGDGPNGANLIRLIGHFVQLLGDPYTNPAVAALPLAQSRAVAYLTTEAAAHLHDA